MQRESATYLGPAYDKGSARTRKLSTTQIRVRDAILVGDSPDDYEEFACPCGTSAGGDVVVAAVERHGLDCRNVICPVCGLIRISPRWNQARYRRFYETEYRDLYNAVSSSKEEFTRSIAALPNVKEFGAWIESAMARHGDTSTPPAVIEIGAGGGWNLAVLPGSWRKIGYDVDREYLAIASGTFGVEMRFGLLDEALEAVGTADAVILSHVVEHFANPAEALGSLAVRMKPSALLLIEVPGLFRIHRSALDPMTFMQNAHTFTFCGRTLTDACESASLQVLQFDEMCRVVCRKSGKGISATAHPGLTSRILRYLWLCEIGSLFLLNLREIPIAGRLLGAIWRRLYFPCLKFLVPEKCEILEQRRIAK